MPLFGAALVLCGGFALGVPACTPRQAPPALASGERPVTGVPRFDQFFAELSSALSAVQEGRREEAEARGALARRVALPESAAVDVLGERLRERTSRWAAEGLTLELEFTGLDGDGGERVETSAEGSAEGQPPAAPGGEADGNAEGDIPPPTATLRTPGREPEGRELRLLEALAQAALSGATVYSDMGRVRKRIERLTLELGELETNVDSSISDVVDRERVRGKLKEARELLPSLNTQAREVWGSADTLVALLDEAANTVPAGPRRRGVVPTKDNLPPRLVPRSEPRPPPPTTIGPSTPASPVAPLTNPTLPASPGTSQ